jgi:hypothetical protein
MSHEKRKILEMLSAKKITVDEAERLLTALGESSGNKEMKSKGLHSKYLRVLVEPAENNPNGERVNVRVPMNLIRAGLKWASYIPKEAQGKVEEALKAKGIDMDFQKIKSENLEELISNINDLQVEVEGKEKVRVFCE